MVVMTMVGIAKPAHGERLGIIVMMGNYALFAADFAGLANDLAASDGRLNQPIGAPALRTLDLISSAVTGPRMPDGAISGTICLATRPVCFEFLAALWAICGRHSDPR